MNVGDKAPEILGLNEKGEEIRLSDYKGKKVVLYFYPKDMTSGCTAQACNLRDNYTALREAGYEVIGVSINDQKSHQKFIEKNNLPFTLIADTEQKLVQEFGVWGEKSMYGERKACMEENTWERSVQPSSSMKKVSSNGLFPQKK